VTRSGSRARALLAVVAAASVVSCVPDGPRPTRDRVVDALVRVLDAEDARPTAGPELAVLVESAHGEDVRTRRVAVRALGRLERPELSAEIARHLVDPDAGVRAVAAEALVQSVHNADRATVFADLLARVDVEDSPLARGALARSIGRLGLERPVDRRRAAIALAHLGAADGASPDEQAVLGVALGFEALLRGATDEGLERAAAERLDFMATYGLADPAVDSVVSARVRALAVRSLGPVRRLGREEIERAQRDPDAEVRRAPLRYLGAVAPSQRAALLRRALDDSSPRVAIDALRILAAGPRTAETCGWLQAAARTDAETSVRLVALEALARPCPDQGAQTALLREAAAEPAASGAHTWHAGTRALMSLARLNQSTARDLLPVFATHVSPFARVYAVAVAGAVDDEAALEVLAADRSPNVRGAALDSLFTVRGHRIDALLLDQLASDDPQLLMTVARLLAGSPGRNAVAAALLVKFERLSEARRETWRDPRLALLERVAELGDTLLADRLRPFLADYDPVVAAEVARVLGTWTGQTAIPGPSPLARAPLPSRAELTALERASVVLHMSGGDTILIQLLPDLAPRNVWRFVSLAREGHFDGLTFHRWEANFVLQGGSPGANEYSGDGPYTRDEVGGSHWRGTVGVSTRGRDTGDGQIFVNLVDNVRLDHDYTVFGFVSEGMEIVDGLLEGAIIERAEVLQPD
jgi:cyclophilin family peptidyl-prolyl cis-trans isomerase/HEAT repeat protein